MDEKHETSFMAPEHLLAFKKITRTLVTMLRKLNHIVLHKLFLAIIKDILTQFLRILFYLFSTFWQRFRQKFKQEILAIVRYFICDIIWLLTKPLSSQIRNSFANTNLIWNQNYQIVIRCYASVTVVFFAKFFGFWLDFLKFEKNALCKKLHQ